MPFLGNSRLAAVLGGTKVISPFDKNNIKNGAYELCLGTQVFQTDGVPREIKMLKKAQEIYIKPGQFALLLTEETVKIPEDKIAFISIKAGIKFKGLVNVSGFHVDPGFEGKLLFSVYNAGPSTIPLRRGDRYFPMWFAELDEKQSYQGNHKKQTTIPLDPVEALSQGDLASPSALLEKMKADYQNLDSKLDKSSKNQASRIDLIEKEQKAIDYLVKTAVGLGVIIVLKFALDWTVFSYGTTRGGELRQTEMNAESNLNNILMQKKMLLLEIDSLQKIQNDLSTSESIIK